MANDSKGNGWGPFERGGAYVEVGPGLGSLHDAWDVETGKPVLQLLPTDRVEWQPAGPWRVVLLCEPEPTTVTVRVEEAPASMPVSELADVLVLTSAAVTRVEHSARLRAHLASGLSAPLSVPRRNPRRAATWTGLALGLGVWLLVSLSVSPTSVEQGSSSELFAPWATSSFVDLAESDPAAIAYPMPEKPLPGQALPPCKRNRSVVEINGGCWVSLDQKPPCDPDTAEYQGKCYMPGSTPKKTPRAVDP